jgi:putative SOS response-associated peptidase YedK
MEWGEGKDAAGKRRQGWHAVADQPIFAFAAVWKDSEVPSMALLSCEPNAVMRQAGRDTMPVILPADREAQDLWLNGDWARASRLIAPYSSSQMLTRDEG